jgi:zinc transport system substrate-binding protein/iron/zinc/copper transport system substrate-binding protein
MMHKSTVFFLLVAICLVPVLAQGVDETSAASNYASYSGQPADVFPVVASTSWVAAMARAAGAREVTVLAPIELKHPPEYDFRPGDIIAATKAQWILWAGYEGFIKNLTAAAGIPQEKVVLTNTNNTPPVVRESVRKLAQQLGTLDSYQAWERELSALEAELVAGAKTAGTSGIKAAVQFHHQALARWLGYQVVYVFGPGELTMTQLQEIEALRPGMIIDNWHMAQGEPLRKSGRTYVQLLNFPGAYRTASILDVLRYNAALLKIL